ncbi:hypothetical protein [Larkinella soli]|uniref:hypothetical protein n=1 Tax=Larkinella soli TaxID=1770527 RepID=UPI000FFB1D4B|nr:hypothetical protein [Larkinella soli]
MTPSPKTGQYFFIGGQATRVTPEHLRSNTPLLPIPITRLWLVGFGFRPEPTDGTWTLDDARLIPDRRFYICHRSRRHFQYVHELQDWYQARYKAPLVLGNRPKTARQPLKYAITL